MEPFSGDTEESTQDITGGKNSKIKSLKTRLFRRSKKEDTEANVKLSQSASDITAGKELGSDEDLVSSQRTMGSRTFSHDSIFLDDPVLTDSEPARVSSQENVLSKIKTLQMKLQLQKMHFGPPPMVLPIKSQEEPSDPPEDFTFYSSNNVSGDETLQKASSPKAFSPISSFLKSTPTKSHSPTPFNPFSAPRSSSTSTAESPLDFNKPAEFTASLDTSAARHRMSIKPRNQRAGTKKKNSSVPQSGSPLHNLKNLPEFVEKKEQQLVVQDEVEDTENEKVDVSHYFLLKPAEVPPVTQEAAPKLTSLSFTQQDHETVASQVLRFKSPRRVNTVPPKRPHSSFIESEIRGKRGGDLETQVMPDKKMEVSPEQLSMFSSEVTSRSSSAQQQLHGEEENSRWVKRPQPGSDSISTVKNQDGERSRSSSFVGSLEVTEAKNKTTVGTREKEEPKSTQLKGSPFAAERLRQEGSPSRGPAVLWERKTSLKRAESAAQTKNIYSDTAAVEAEEEETGQEVEDEAEGGKTPFGIKLRSTSLSLKYRSENTFNRHSKTELSDDQEDKKERQETAESTNRISEKLPTNTSCALRPKDPAPSGMAPEVKHNTSTTDNSPPVPTEVQTTSSNNKEAETNPLTSKTSSSEVSWMTLAMEKTRSLQQLFTSRFPRDFTGMQASVRPQAQVQPKTQTEITTGTPILSEKVEQSASPPSSEAIKEAVQSRSQEHVVKPSEVALQQKMIITKPPMSKQPNEAQLVSHPVSQPTQSCPWTTESPVRSSSQTTTTSQPLAQSKISSGQQQQQQPPWTNKGFQPGTQIKSTTSAETSESAVTSTTVPASNSASDKGETEATAQKDSPLLISRRTIWTGSVAERAAFLEKRAEWTTPPLLRGTEKRKVQTEAQTSDDAQDISQVVQPAESSPIRVVEKPREDKWPRKNVESPLSPSLLHTRPSVLQSMSESGQPSWMDLAKRKSMAWSDKTMD